VKFARCERIVVDWMHHTLDVSSQCSFSGSVLCDGNPWASLGLNKNFGWTIGRVEKRTGSGRTPQKMGKDYGHDKIVGNTSSSTDGNFAIYFCTFFLFFLHFFCQYMCIVFLLWAASYDGLSLHWQPANVAVDVYYLCYVLGK